MGRLRAMAARHRWSLRLAGVALAVVVVVGPSVGTLAPAGAEPSTPRSPAAPAQTIEGELWAACTAFNDLLDVLPFDPRRPFDVSTLKTPPEQLGNIVRLVFNDLKTAVSVAVGESLLGRITGLGMTIEEWFVEQVKKWTPPSGKYAPQWYQHEITRYLECELVEKVVLQPCGPVPAAVSAPGTFLPERCWGTYPTAGYDLGYDQADPIRRPSRDLWGVTANLLFTFAKNAIRMGLFIMGWAFSIDMRDYDVFALTAHERYQVHLVLGLDLRHAAWLALVGWAGFTTLRNRGGRAAGELLVSVVMIGVCAAVMARPGFYLDEVWDVMDRGSDAVLAAADDRPSCEVLEEIHHRDFCGNYASTSLAPVQRQIQVAFIEQPYDYLNWGGNLTGACAEARNHIVSTGPHGDNGWPRRHMARAGDECRAAARFNASPSGDRWFGALLNLVAATLVFVMLLLSSLTLLLAKFMVAFLFALLPFAAVMAILPGGGRRAAFQWLGALVQGILAVIGISVLFSMLLLALDAVLGATGDFGLVERWLVVDIVVIAAYAGRRRIVAGTQAAASSLADKLTRMSPAGADVSRVNAGMALGGGDTAMRRLGNGTAIAVGSAVGAAGMVYAQRRREKRMAKLTYRNLKRVEHWKRGLHEPMYEHRMKLVPDGGSGGGFPTGGGGDDGGPSPSGPPPTPIPTRTGPRAISGGGGVRTRKGGKGRPGQSKPSVKGRAARRRARAARAGTGTRTAAPRVAATTAAPAPRPAPAPARPSAPGPRPRHFSPPPFAAPAGFRWEEDLEIVQTGRLPADVPGMERGEWGGQFEGRQRQFAPGAVGRRDRARIALGRMAMRRLR
jgi:hypothetical protein